MSQTLSAPALPVKHRSFLTLSLMAATTMQVLDTTIANVALPHMQGSLSAAQDQIAWVLTSYIVAAAIATPLTGWFASKFGRKELILVSVAGFTLASMLCGMATSLTEIVAFRFLQGVFGASLVPLAQSIMLDINPRERVGQAMAMLSIAKPMKSNGRLRPPSPPGMKMTVPIRARIPIGTLM